MESFVNLTLRESAVIPVTSPVKVAPLFLPDVLFRMENDFEPLTAYTVNCKVFDVIHWLALIYLLSVHLGVSAMKDKKRYEIRRWLILWNVVATIFSFFGAARTTPILWKSLTRHGLQHTLCDSTFILGNNVSSFWTVLFGYSKIVEFIDTLFIVLRKQKLTFVHWYHHTTVLVFSWMTYVDKMAVSQWFCVMNFIVHTMMYGYYAFRAMGFRIPRIFSLMITTSQIIQMVLGTVFTSMAYLYFLKDHESCSMTHRTGITGLAIYLSYFVLFVHFFYVSYIKSDGRTVAKKQNTKVE